MSLPPQVELIDSQGNAVMKSLPTPLLFKSSPSSTSSTNRSPSTYTTTPSSSTSTARKPPTVPTYISVSRDFPERSSDERLLRLETGSLDSIVKDDLHGFLQDQGDLMDVSPRESVIPEENSRERIHDRIYDRTDFAVKNETERKKVLLAEVSATEILTTGTTETASQVIVWCVGVGIGALLLLTLCSLVIWLLNRCRKTTVHEEEDTEEGLNDVQSSFRAEVAQQNHKNQTTSWTFENFCSVSRKSKFVPPQRNDAVPAGIDNASLMENYVFMLESPPSGSKTKR